MKITFHGHACFSLEGKQNRLIIDPFLSGNPVAKLDPDDVKVEYIILSHAHNDHLGDTVAIAKNNDAMVICSHETSQWLSWQGVKTHGMSIGGSFTFDFGQVQMVPAFHGNGYVNEPKKEIVYMGMPAGLVIQMNEHTIYHAGDTSLYSDMQLIKRKYQIDLAMIPIGDNYTMGPEDALTASEWVGARAVIPMHYNTFPPIKQNPYIFSEKLKEKGIKGIVLDIEEKINL